MEIQPREIYNQSVAYYEFVTRVKFFLSLVFFFGLIHSEISHIAALNLILSAINCILIINLLEILPRMYRDTLRNNDKKYIIPKAILDWASSIILGWIFISTAIDTVFIQ